MNELKNIPNHVAIIYDGNRRWAKSRGLNPSEGHVAGAKNITENVVQYAKDFNIRYLTIWLFSTENWKRSEKEVSIIMQLLKSSIQDFYNKFIEEKIRFHHIGRKDRFPQDIVKLINKLEKDTEHFDDHHLCLALDHGGRDEIIRATRQIVKDGLDPDDITEERFSEYLDTRGIPNPDLIIRTSGEFRLSGFMAWEATYSELYFTDKNGPDLDKEEFAKAIDSYSKRKRRFGGDGKK